MKIKIKTLKRFSDKRGFFIETYTKKKLHHSKIDFIEDDVSCSKKNVLRGFHGDFKTWKLITCIFGKVQLAYINLNKSDKNYKENKCIILDSLKPKQVLIPPGFGVAYLTLSKKTIINYKQTEYYGKNKQFDIHYKSPCLNFKWRSKKIVTSRRDKNSKKLF